MIEAIKEQVRKVPDFPKKGIVFLDITTAIKNPDTLNKMIDFLYEEYKDKKIDYSNFRSTATLSEVMEKFGIPGIYGIDTRKLNRSIRDFGLNARSYPLDR